MTLRASARCIGGTGPAARIKRKSGIVIVDAGRMSTSISAYGRAAHNRKSSRKSIANHVLGGASVACLLLGCAWTVYANIFAASVYPQLGSTGFDVPVTRQPATARSAAVSA